MNKKIKVALFLGTERGLATLRALIKNRINLISVLVLEQQEHEINNVASDIILLCKKHKIPYKTSNEIRPGNYQEYLKEIKADIVFAISWRFLIPSVCFNVPNYGIFIVHDSLVPKYRGFAPTNWVIINGENETGLTLMYISKLTDGGDIIDQIKIKISKDEDANTLNDKFLKIYPRIILKNINKIVNGENKRILQNNAVATYGCKRTPEDGRIDFSRSTMEIVRLIRGCAYPYPGAFCYLNGQKIIIWKAERVKDPPVYAGRVVGRVVNIKQEYADVLTTDGILRIKEISLDKETHKRCPLNQIFKSVTYKLA